MSRTSRFAFLAVATLALAACQESPTTPPSRMSPSGPAAFSVQAAPEQVMAGEVIVALVDGADVGATAREHGLEVEAAGYANAFYVMRGAAGNEHANAAAMRGDARVRYAEPNYLRQVTADADPRLWAFYNPGSLNMNYTTGPSKGKPLGGTYASKADADEDNLLNFAASINGGDDVVIGSIDTGVDLAHPEFTGRLIAGKDWYTGDNTPADEEGHGTHTTGTMAGSTVGIAGFAGAASHVRVLVQRVCGRRGCPTSAIVNAIYAAADYPGMVAMNLSLGGSTESKAEKDAILYATGKGVLVIASAGNAGTGTVECPACDPNAISVSATNWKDVLTYYSSWGSGLDISAPGGECYSNTTAEGCIYSAYLAGGYTWMQGTSMAAPQVTGTAGLVAWATGLRGAALRKRIIDSVDDIGDPGTDTKFGAGRLNTYRAVTGGSAPAGQ